MALVQQRQQECTRPPVGHVKLMLIVTNSGLGVLLRMTESGYVGGVPFGLTRFDTMI